MVKSPNPTYYEILESRSKILLGLLIGSGIGVLLTMVNNVFEDDYKLISTMGIPLLIQVIVLFLSIVGLIIINRKKRVEHEKKRFECADT